MISFFKKWFRKEEKEEELIPNIDTDCMIAYSVSPDGDLLLSFNVMHGREPQFIGLLYRIHSGKLREFTSDYLLGFASKCGQDSYAQVILDGLDREFALNSYNGESLDLDDEDPIICPTDVFRGSNDTD